MPVFLLSEKKSFPSPNLASREGLLAVGGDLNQQRLLRAYRLGIFPWFADDDPILWWSPDPRLVLYPGEMRVSRTLKKIIKKKLFRMTIDSAFDQVINSCAQIRVEKNEGTWIGPGMIDAYCRLHESGFAHSVEAWQQDRLVGGIYGVSLGKCFFGESMFSRVSNASSVALIKLVEHLKALSFDMLDCQVTTDHLLRFGAREIPRSEFLKQLKNSLATPTIRGRWSFHP